MKSLFVIRAGSMQWIFLPTSPQTRSGTPVFGAGVGSATGDILHKAPGQRFGQLIVYLFGLSKCC